MSNEEFKSLNKEALGLSETDLPSVYSRELLISNFQYGVHEIEAEMVSAVDNTKRYI